MNTDQKGKERRSRRDTLMLCKSMLKSWMIISVLENNNDNSKCTQMKDVSRILGIGKSTIKLKKSMLRHT